MKRWLKGLIGRERQKWRETKLPGKSRRLKYRLEKTNGLLNIEFMAFVPVGFDDTPPTSAIEVLHRTKALFVQEGNWRQSSWFTNKHPEVDPEDAYCNNWAACMDGGLIAVTLGCHRFHRPDNSYSAWYMDAHMDRDLLLKNDAHLVKLSGLLQEARRYVSLAAVERWGNIAGWGVTAFPRDGSPSPDVVASYNDKHCGTRTEALKWLDGAIAIAEQRTVDA